MKAVNTLPAPSLVTRRRSPVRDREPPVRGHLFLKVFPLLHAGCTRYTQKPRHSDFSLEWRGFPWR